MPGAIPCQAETKPDSECSNAELEPAGSTQIIVRIESPKLAEDGIADGVPRKEARRRNNMATAASNVFSHQKNGAANLHGISYGRQFTKPTVW